MEDPFTNKTLNRREILCGEIGYSPTVGWPCWIVLTPTHFGWSYSRIPFDLPFLFRTTYFAIPLSDITGIETQPGRLFAYDYLRIHWRGPDGGKHVFEVCPALIHRWLACFRKCGIAVIASHLEGVGPVMTFYRRYRPFILFGPIVFGSLALLILTGLFAPEHESLAFIIFCLLFPALALVLTLWKLLGGSEKRPMRS